MSNDSQDIINYNINTKKNNNSSLSMDKSHFSNIPNQESLVEIEQNNIHMLILQRSLYILKKSYDQNKKDIESIFEEYKNPQYKNLRCIDTTNLLDIYKKLINTMQIDILSYENFNELLAADLISKYHEEKKNTIIKSLVKYTKANIEKYNKIYYEKKMKKILLKKEKEQKSKPEEIEMTDQVKIIHKNKRGGIIHDFEKMLQNNIKLDIKDMIFPINEDDMSIITNKNLLYNDVILLIIADYIQNSMAKNSYIGIITTYRGINNEELNEDVKILYDKEIIKLYNNLNRIDPSEEKNEQLKTLLLQSNNIDNKIKIYKNLIVEKSNKGLQVDYLVDMIQQLKVKQIHIQKKISEINSKEYINNKSSYNEKSISTINSKTNNNNTSIYHDTKIMNTKSSIKLKSTTSKKMNKNEIRKNNLFEIFCFYCKQHATLGKQHTIDMLLNKEKQMTISEFSKFCVEFKILLKNKEISDVFRKFSKNISFLNFQEFLECLKKMAILVAEGKKNLIKEKISLNKLKLDELDEKIKNEKNSENKKENKENDENENNENENEEKQSNIKDNEEDKEKEKEEQKSNNKDVKSEDNNEDKEDNEENEENENLSEGKNSQNEEINQKKILLNEKKQIEETNIKLQNDLAKLEEKTFPQMEEDLYSYLEIDNTELYRKKMKGYTKPFLIREDDTRNLKQNVKHPIKFNHKVIRETYDIIMKKKYELKKEKELQKNRERDIQFQKRMKQFNKEVKKLERDYRNKIAKDNYFQIRKNEEDYLKEKNSKITWNSIQKYDYDNFLLNDDYHKNVVKPNLQNIFVNKSNDFFDNEDDDDFMNKIYSNNNSNSRQGNIYSNRGLSQNRNQNFIKNPSLSVQSRINHINKRI